MLAKALKSEKKFDEILIVKDTQILELLEYKKQWNYLRFAKLEELIQTLEREKATLKAKYKHKVIVKTEAIKAELGKELYAVQAELDIKSDLLEQKEIELEGLYSRVEELEMMQSTNSLEVKEVHRRYKVQISQLKSELDT